MTPLRAGLPVQHVALAILLLGATTLAAATTTTPAAATGASIEASARASAAAYTTRSKRRPGKLRIYQTVGTHTRICNGYLDYGGVSIPNCVWAPTIHIPGPKVWRSPRNKRAQLVTVTYRIQRWDVGAWRPQASETHTYRIRKRQRSIRLPSPTLFPTAALYLRTVLSFVWTNPRNGRRLGRTTVTMNQAGDYACATRFPCQAGDGWVWLRHP